MGGPTQCNGEGLCGRAARVAGRQGGVGAAATCQTHCSAILVSSGLLPPATPPPHSPDCRVYYYWALQQERQGFVGEDGAYHPPRWQLREMLIRGMHHLL